MKYRTKGADLNMMYSDIWDMPFDAELRNESAEEIVAVNNMFTDVAQEEAAALDSWQLDEVHGETAKCDVDTQDDAELHTIIDKHIAGACSLLQNTENWSQQRFDESQRTLIHSIIFDLYKGSNVVLEAPTGTGKSIIAYFVGTFFNSYILTSDKMLQEQYDKWISKNIKRNVGKTKVDAKYSSMTMLKGRDNYFCNVNGGTFSAGVCQQDGMSLKQAMRSMPCAKHCEYLLLRNAAAMSRVAVLNYHFWLMLMNVVRGDDFVPRLTIFDECHKIDDILQGFMDLNIGPKFIRDMGVAEQFMEVAATFEDKTAYAEQKQNFFTCMQQIIQKASIGQNGVVLQDDLSALANYADAIVESVAAVDAYLDKKLREQKKLDKHERAFKAFMDKLSQITFQIDALQNATKDSPNDILVVLNQSDNSVSIKCINDALLANTLVHPVCNGQLWMSATIGDMDSFVALNDIKNAKCYSIESGFDFSRSPIFLSKPAISLSYANIDKNLAVLVQRIDDILDLHPMDNCLIHTCTKRITQHICMASRHADRMLTYSNAAEKAKMLDKLTKNSAYVIVGHSLTEGIDLHDYKCRVQIVAKLSWASMGDLVVKTKADNHPEWYLLKTLQHLIQSIGRGIRHKDDWCKTYILDSSFSRLKKMLKFTPVIEGRLKDGDDLNRDSMHQQAAESMPANIEYKPGILDF